MAGELQQESEVMNMDDGLSVLMREGSSHHTTAESLAANGAGERNRHLSIRSPLEAPCNDDYE